MSIFNGDIEIDTGRLQAMVVENLSAEEQAKLQFVEDIMYGIEEEMKTAGFGGLRVTEAQVLFSLCLYDHAQTEDFVSKLTAALPKIRPTRSSSTPSTPLSEQKSQRRNSRRLWMLSDPYISTPPAISIPIQKTTSTL